MVGLLSFSLGAIFSKLLRSAGQKVADRSGVLGEAGEGSAFEGSENDSVHPHVSDVLEIVPSETKGQGLLLEGKNPQPF